MEEDSHLSGFCGLRLHMLGSLDPALVQINHTSGGVLGRFPPDFRSMRSPDSVEEDSEILPGPLAALAVAPGEVQGAVTGE